MTAFMASNEVGHQDVTVEGNILHMPVDHFRSHLSEHLNEVKFRGKSVVILRSGKPAGVLISHAAWREAEAQKPEPLVRCTRCKQDKPVSEYHKNARRKAGVQFWCKPCQNAACKQSREKRKLKQVDVATVAPVQPAADVQLAKPRGFWARLFGGR